ncbi:MAG: DUF2189 domain-containing protein [Betaproteobacteria bacterium]|nr:DUF2189 domain-containing protein [Betaproteobacteria bacterium]
MQPESDYIGVMTPTASSSTVVHPQRIPLGSPLRWLARGWRDLNETRFLGMFYGAVFVAMGLAIEWIYGALWQMTMGLTAGFFLMGPFVCCGIYELSRQRQDGEHADLRASMFSWLGNWKSIGFFAAMLTFLMIIWARVSVVVFALLSPHEMPTVAGVFGRLLSVDNLEFLAVWAAVGSVFAGLAFAISVVSVPLMLDRRADTLEAIFRSAHALWVNPLAMLLWALTIVLMIGASLAFFLPALAITAPLIGHATWHAYKDLLEAS